MKIVTIEKLEVELCNIKAGALVLWSFYVLSIFFAKEKACQGVTTRIKYLPSILGIFDKLNFIGR